MENGKPFLLLLFCISYKLEMNLEGDEEGNEMAVKISIPTR